MRGAAMEVSLIDPRQPASQQLGKYRLVATLGQGGMGTVYLALASGVGQFRKLLVVKELLPELTRKPGFVDMFLDEARLAARLEHPNVVQTFEAGEDAGRYYLAMEYLDGQPLHALLERLKDRGGLPLPVHLHILGEVLAGLQYAHELRDYDGTSLGVVHRDISPQNVFITYHGQVKVVDFGVAKAANASALTHPGVFKGKFGYAAPEQILGRPVDARTDVFAVGVMLWQALAGRRFSDPIPTPESFRARATGAEPRILQVAPEVDELLADICDNALEVDPERRLRSAQEFLDDLVEYQVFRRMRVESSEIGSLMREVFAEERRIVHGVIEQAMKHEDVSPSVVKALPFLQQETEKAPTSVADLSSLVEVSHASDDEEIRRKYAQSMSAPVPTPPPPPPPRRGLASILAQRTIATAAGAFSVALIVWVSARLFGGPETATSTSTSASRVPPSAAAPVVPETAAPPPAPHHSQPAANAPVQPPPSAASAPPPSAVAETQPSAARSGGSISIGEAQIAIPRSERPAETQPSRRVEPAARATPPAAKAYAAPQPRLEPSRPPFERRTPGARAGAGADEPEMGTDLRTIRRTNVGRMRIDVEDPYK